MPADSVLVLDLAPDCDQGALAVAILALVPAPDGGPWSKIGGGRAQLTAAVSKALRDRFAEAELLLELRRLPGVTGAALGPGPDPAAPVVRPTRPMAAMPVGGGLHWHEQIALPAARTALEARVAAGRAWALDRIRVAVVDTGYTEHPCFGPWTDGRNDVVLVAEGLNLVEAGRPPLDPLKGRPILDQPGHGTRIASVIGAASDDLSGVARGARLVPCRVTNSILVDTPVSNPKLSTALRHAVDTGCRVVNISMGNPLLGDSDTGRGVDLAYEAGVIVVAAAGNITGEVTFPGRYSRTITAGGVTPTLRPWRGGSCGPRVDVCGPATEVFRADWNRRTAPPSVVYGHRNGSGTSYATAFVSGLAAIWTAWWGDELDRIYDESWQRIEAFRLCLRDSAGVPAGVGLTWKDEIHGTGVVDAGQLLQSPLPRPGLLKKRPSAARERH